MTPKTVDEILHDLYDPTYGEMTLTEAKAALKELVLKKFEDEESYIYIPEFIKKIEEIFK